jgi:hypothetical protein
MLFMLLTTYDIHDTILRIIKTILNGIYNQAKTRHILIAIEHDKRFLSLSNKHLMQQFSRFGNRC